MSLSNRERVKAIFYSAMELHDAARAEFLDQACAGDDRLRRDIESLLAHDHDNDDVFNEARLGVGCELVAGAAEDSELNSDARFPDAIGRYRILEQIGEGGMGTVLAAEQDSPRRRVALKMIRPSLLSQKMMRRFKFETHVLGRLQHPGIAQIYEAGQIESAVGRQPYFAMEYVEGMELRAYAERHGLDARTRLELVARICDAVHHAHQKGIIHRDLKPENILVVSQPPGTIATNSLEFSQLGQPKILDFGVALATDSDVQMTTIHTDVGMLVGTLAYMSPEQVAGDSRLLDTRADIYALGAILYELLAGRPPFDLQGRTIPDAVRIICEEEPTRLSSFRVVLRGDVDTIVSKALEKERERRYQSAAEMATDIRRHLSHEPIAAHPPSTFYQLGKFAKRNRGLVAGLALAFLILVAGAVSSLTFGLRAMRGEAQAQNNAHRLSITTAAALGDDDPVRALRCLGAVPQDSREWEWRHLYARFVSHIAEWNADGQAEMVDTLARRDDGLLIAALPREGNVELVELATGDILDVFQTEGGLAAPCLSPSGEYLAALAPAQSDLIVWDIGSKRCILKRPIDVSAFLLSRFNLDGSLLAIHTLTEGAAIVETATGRVRLRFTCESGCTGPIAFDPCGRLIAVHGGREPGVRALNVNLYSVDGEHLAGKGLPESCESIAFSPNGELLVVGTRQQAIRVLDSTTLEELHVLQGHTAMVSAVAFSPDGAYCASASLDSTIRIWNAATGRTERVLTGPFSGGGPRSLAFSADGAMLACGQSGQIMLWDLARSASTVLRGHGTYVYRVAFSPDPDSHLIASASYMGETRLWDACSGELLAEFPGDTADSFIAFSPDGSRLITGGSNFKHPLAVWDTGAGRLIEEPRSSADDLVSEPSAHSYQFAVGGASGGAARIGSAAASSLDRRLLAYALPSGQICIEHLTTGREIKHIGQHDSNVYAVTFNPQATRIITADSEGAIRVWDVSTGAEIARMTGHTGSVYDVEYSPDGERIASAGSDGSIILWDARSYEQVLVLHDHASYVHAVGFSPDGTMLASASGDGTVRIWDSVPPENRWRRMQRIEALRREATPLVDRLLAEFADPLDAADHIRSDGTLDGEQRNAALHVLLKRSGGIADADP